MDNGPVRLLVLVGLLAPVPAAALTRPVLLSPATLWHESFGVRGTSLVGYFDADDRADIVNFDCGPAGDVRVALSEGTRFGTSRRWSTGFCAAGEVPMVGDFDGDGLDDVVVFTRGLAGDVFVALSDGTRFG